MQERIIVVVFAGAVLLQGSPAEAQGGRMLGAAMAIAGGAMLVLDPTQPVQPTQPGQVSRDTLIEEAADFIAGPCGTNPVSCEFRQLALSIEPDLLVIERRGVLVGGIAGAAVGIGVATDGQRTVYAGPFQPFIPFNERSSGLKYGGLALVAGGALLAVLWPDSPADQVAVAATPGGVRASKSFGW